MITVITYISFFLNIIPVILYLNKLWKQWTIKKILGSKKLDKMILTFPTFGIHCKDISNMPAEAKAQRCFFHIPSKTRQYEAYGFKVCPTTSLAEVRSISYLNSMLNIISITPEIESDASDKIDTNYSDNMISLGFDCYMTIENLKDNPFIDIAEDNHNIFTIKDSLLVFKSDICPNIGIILRRCNDENNVRISCAGFTEWGTSGAAYCLAKKYNIIINYIKKTHPFFCNFKIPDFLCLIEADPCHDQNVKIRGIWIRDINVQNSIRKVYDDNVSKESENVLSSI